MTLAVRPGDRPAESLRPPGPSGGTGLLRGGSIRWSLPASFITHVAVLCAAVIVIGEPTKFEGKEEDAISIEIVSVEEVAAPDPSPSPSVAAAETKEPDTPEPAETSPVADPKPVDPVEARPVETEVEEAEPAPPVDAPKAAEAEPLPPTEAPQEIESAMPTVLGHTGADASDPVPPPAEAVEPVEKAAELAPVPEEEEEEPAPKAKPEEKAEKREKAEKKPAKTEKGAKKKPSGKALASAREGTDSAGGQRRKASGNASISNYVGQIAAKLQRQKRYPDGAKRRGVAGTVLISFTIAGSGAVTGSKLVRSSGAAELDREVRAMLDRASPFPPIPEEMGRNSLTITVPIRFSLR